MAGRIILPGAGPIFRGKQGMFMSGAGRIGGFDASLGPAGVRSPTTLPLHARIAFEGDSITAGSSGPTYAELALMRNNGRFYQPFTSNQAQAGRNTIQMAARTASVNALRPDVVVIMGGTNGNKGLAGWQDISSCALSYLKSGRAMYVIIMPCIPDGTLDAANETARQLLNTYIQGYATDPITAPYAANIRACPSVEATFNPATMSIGDTRHPNWIGANVIATALLTVLEPLITTSVDHLALYNDTSNLFNTYSKNPQLAGTTGGIQGGGQVATSWQGATQNGASPTWSKTTMIVGTGTVQITGTTATISGYSGQPIQIGQGISAASGGTTITAYGSGTGGNGTYTVNNSQSLGSIATNITVTAQRALVSGTATSGAFTRMYNQSALSGFTAPAGSQYDMWMNVSIAAGHLGIMNIQSSFGSSLLRMNNNVSPYVMDGMGALSGVFRTFVFSQFAVDTTNLQAFLFQINFAAGTVAADITISEPTLRLNPNP